MFLKQYNKKKNIFYRKEFFHNYLSLFGSLMILLLSIFLLIKIFNDNNFILYNLGIVSVLILLSVFKIMISLLLISRLNEIKNKLEPERMNIYIYQSSWMRKKISSFWITIVFAYLWIILMLIFIVFSTVTNQFTWLQFGFYSTIIVMTIIVGVGNWFVINSFLASNENLISTQPSIVFDNELETKRLVLMYRKKYLTLLIIITIFPLFLLFNKNFKEKYLVLIGKNI
ncbi:MAG: hypothetical protein GQ557_00515 [Mycoplasmataceae bacterium]|nr:hypothetical protein [Mycoplasmataceae bacterium]